MRAMALYLSPTKKYAFELSAPPLIHESTRPNKSTGYPSEDLQRFQDILQAASYSIPQSVQPPPTEGTQHTKYAYPFAPVESTRPAPSGDTSTFSLFSTERSVASETVALDKISPVRYDAGEAAALDKKSPVRDAASEAAASILNDDCFDSSPQTENGCHPEDAEHANNCSVPANITTEKGHEDLILVIKNGALLPSEFNRVDATDPVAGDEERPPPGAREGELVLVVQHGVLLSAAAHQARARTGPPPVPDPAAVFSASHLKTINEDLDGRCWIGMDGREALVSRWCLPEDLEMGAGAAAAFERAAAQEGPDGSRVDPASAGETCAHGGKNEQERRQHKKRKLDVAAHLLLTQDSSDSRPASHVPVVQDNMRLPEEREGQIILVIKNGVLLSPAAHQGRARTVGANHLVAQHPSAVFSVAHVQKIQEKLDQCCWVDLDSQGEPVSRWCQPDALPARIELGGGETVGVAMAMVCEVSAEEKILMDQMSPGALNSIRKKKKKKSKKQKKKLLRAQHSNKAARQEASKKKTPMLGKAGGQMSGGDSVGSIKKKKKKKLENKKRKLSPVQHSDKVEIHKKKKKKLEKKKRKLSQAQHSNKDDRQKTGTHKRPKHEKTDEQGSAKGSLGSVRQQDKNPVPPTTPTVSPAPTSHPVPGPASGAQTGKPRNGTRTPATPTVKTVAAAPTSHPRAGPASSENTGKQSGGKLTYSTPAEGLPPGWRKEGITRLGGVYTKGRLDTYWYNPTGKRFRSRPEIHKYMEELHGRGVIIEGYHPGLICGFPNHKQVWVSKP